MDCETTGLFFPKSLLSCIREFVANSENGDGGNVSTTTEAVICDANCRKNFCLTKQDLNVQRFVQCLTKVGGRRLMQEL
ncbi:hypothetical protein QE152_g27632 [Popillia japonica]|uniref:Uncharacterized protein n=1 Tax=Popillia japonica TaxID=7064 RepID=A0AAW1JR66_POPJA